MARQRQTGQAPQPQVDRGRPLPPAPVSARDHVFRRPASRALVTRTGPVAGADSTVPRPHYAMVTCRSMGYSVSMRNQLRLPDLSIKAFRGIEELVIPRLGRVTLLAGENGVGKTTVLEAIRVYATRARHSVLYDLLTERQEVSVVTDDDDDRVSALDWSALFHGWDVDRSAGISIGPANGAKQLKIGHAPLTGQQEQTIAKHLANPPDDPIRGIIATFEGNDRFLGTSLMIPDYIVRHIRQSSDKDKSPSSTTVCEQLGPGTLNEEDIARLWDTVALTDDEDRILKCLNLVVDKEVTGIGIIGHGPTVRSGLRSGLTRVIAGRGFTRAIVKLKGIANRVPLKSLGDGALRLFGVALGFANSRGGFLLIDEAENGIHHTVQNDFWRTILQTACTNDVQVLATTHSWDCVRGFAQALAEFEGPEEGILVRLERDNGRLRAVEYSEEDLEVAAEQVIEVR